jgi:tripartite ATP-independent transporter DctP family solute receptor
MNLFGLATKARLAHFASAFLAAAVLSAYPVGAQTLLKVGHDSPLDFPYHPAAEWFKQEVEAKTEGRISVQIFPNAQLGDEEAMINGLRIGAVDVLYLSQASLSPSVPELGLLNLPFIFKDVDQALRVANGPLVDPIEEKITAAVGAKVAGWASVGDRYMWNSVRPIKTVEDVKGLKMRTAQSAVQQDTYAALGAQPTPMSFTEIYTALQTGVVDGADTALLDVETGKFYQVTKYLSMTRHVIQLNLVLVSEGFLAKLSPEDQAVVMEAAGASADIVTSKSKEQNEMAMTSLKEKGLEIFEIEDAEREKFVAQVQSVYSKNADVVGGMALIEQVLASE